MPLVNTLEMVRTARRGGYAVPAINIVDDLSLRTAIAAAQQVGSPLIVQTSVKTVKSMGADILSYIAHAAARQVDVPIALHLDHCPDRAVISEAIAKGWSSVLFDASDRSLEQARRETAEVCREAHAQGVTVESEIENIVGAEDGVGGDALTHAYSVETLVQVAQETGTDLMAPQLGTAHGLYRAEPKLLVERVGRILEIADIPVVLHGGTGLSPEDFRAFIAAGVSKINISTALKLAYMTACQAHLAKAEATGKWEPVKMFDDVAEACAQVVGENARMFGSVGRAA
ncbi:MAG: class II fructose-bisphosphate aldolase [Propionibacteriaceae bacterium]|nr:class II fructose-bisphosphate aldolase [Propionibacteriaceae bacterium]